MADNPSESYSVQYPYFSLYLRKIEDIQTQKGDTLLQQYIAWSEAYKTEVLSAE